VNRRRPRGFALVITLVLLALLVLAMLALSVMTRVGSEMAGAGVYQTQARQNAALALAVALGELQRHAGEDARLTGMAGLTGVAGNQTASTRYWCGVWRADGSFVAWLTSGAISATSAGPDTMGLIGQGSVGAASSTSVNVEKEHVIAGKVPIKVPDSAGAPGVSATIGSYAYLVVDEGIKLGAYAPAGQRAVLLTAPAIGSSMLSNQRRLKTALETNASVLPTLLSYEQIGLLSPVTPSVLQDCFHYVSLTPRMVVGSQYRTGMINLNTTSTLVWRSLLDTYNAMPDVTQVPDVTNRGNLIGHNFAGTTAGKAANAPFTSTLGFAAYLATIFPLTSSPDYTQILTVLGPMLTVRSDTFRIRAYGEALNPADPARVEATAFCEAIVQRTPDPLPGFGRRFIITYFRWLGPDDI
jgi:Tfp pilus assembly protein PilX